MSIEQNMNCNIQPLPTFLFFGTHKYIFSLKFVHPWKIYHHTKFRRPNLTGAKFTSISEVCHFGMFESTGL